MGSADKKRIREEQNLSPPEGSCTQKQARLMEVETAMAFDKPANACAGNEDLPELLMDPWSWEDSAGFRIGSIAAIRKHSYILDYLQDSAVDNSSEKEVAEQQEEGFLRRSLFEATDDQFWRPQSPLSNVDAMFCLDAMGSHDCTTHLQDESIAQGSALCFRIWEQDDGHKDEKIHTEGISFVYESEVSDWICGIPSYQLQFPESVEFESSMPSL